jgi:2-amino-4-hydroxy-6-hydroxymethyldihydropteridine diphosphokinase
MNAEHIVCILVLGSNVGDRYQYLQAAYQMLAAHPQIHMLKASPVYESAALCPEGAPESWNKPHLNAAIQCITTLPPEALLAAAKLTERDVGRIARERWAPREIDIDILAYGEQRIDTPTLSIPHSGLHERCFAIIPFAELWPDWCYPLPGDAHGPTAANLASQFSADELTKTGLTLGATDA